MTNRTCPFETEIIHSLKTGDREKIQKHLKTCETCREQVRVWHWMQELAQETNSLAPAGAYGPVWLRAKFVKKQEAHQKAIRPLVVTQTVLALLASLAFLLLMNRHWPSDQTWLGNFLSGSDISTTLSFGEISATLMLLFGVLFVVSSLAATFAASTE